MLTHLLFEDAGQIAPGDGESGLNADRLEVTPLGLRQHALGLNTTA